MPEKFSPGEEHANWQAPTTQPSKRPGGELHIRNIQQPDGTWKDGYGESLSPKDARDMAYAARFWERQPDGMLQVAKENLAKATESGQFSMVISPNGPDESDKEKMSAYRQLAKELGYDFGPFELHKNSHTITAQFQINETP